MRASITASVFLRVFISVGEGYECFESVLPVPFVGGGGGADLCEKSGGGGEVPPSRSDVERLQASSSEEGTVSIGPLSRQCSAHWEACFCCSVRRDLFIG